MGFISTVWIKKDMSICQKPYNKIVFIISNQYKLVIINLMLRYDTIRKT